MNVKDIADLVGGVIKGNADLIIERAVGIKDAESDCVTFLGNSKYESLLETTKASCVLVAENFDSDIETTLIKTKDPSYAFAQVLNVLNPELNKKLEGIHPKAVVDKTVQLGKNVAVGACAVIGENVKIGDNCIIYPNVTIYNGAQLGNNVIIHAGTVIGSDGFGYATIDGEHKKIPQLGIVVIEDDVEIGANVTIDRARMDKTIIGQGTKIDNLVQIGHNTIIGKHSIIVSQVGISGSTEIGDHVVLAGQVGVAGHLKIGDKAIVGAQGGVTKSLEAGGKYWDFLQSR